ncbi:amidase signature enzyme [Martensiomyces pterosporus]|nr:amidase signature enzyme [Martensiomyces pterosporus]
MGVLSYVLEVILLRPLQILIWTPARALVHGAIYWSNGIYAKKKRARELAGSPETSLDVYDPILLVSATELSRRIRSRNITAEEVVSRYINRIERVNPLLNGMVADRFDAALEEARAIDRSIAQGDAHVFEDRPFLGAPITIKECIAVKGMPNTYGLRWRQKDCPVAAESSPAIDSLVAAGYIILGVTNTPTLSVTWESDNAIYGRSFNPYDLALNPGGSSSGEAVLLASAASVVGIGTDIGGSICMPALFCGIFGHKPTASLVPTDPPSFMLRESGGSRSNLTKGPLCRYSEDLAPTLSALAGRHLGDPSSVDLSRLRVVVMADGIGHSPFIPAVDREMREAIVRAGESLAEVVAGSAVEFADPLRALADAPFMYGPVFLDGQRPLNETLGGEGHPAASVMWDIVSRLLGRHQYTIGVYGLALDALLLGGAKVADVEPYWSQLQADFEQLLGDNGVLLFPPHPTLAQRHGISLVNKLNFIYTAIFNALGFPVTHAPLGLSKQGIPLGVLVVGRMGQDLTTIAVARELERRFGGWVAPRHIGFA